MRILLATRDDPHQFLTGVAAYVRDLAAALVHEGHEAIHIYLDTPVRRTQPGWCTHTRNGIPVVAVAAPRVPRRAIEGGVEADVDMPALTRTLADAIDAMNPDVVHVHDLFGLPVALIPAMRAHRRPVVVTLHDFWPFCRQLFLVRPGLIPCAGSGGGANCARFCSGTTPTARRLLEAARAAVPARLRAPLESALRLYRRAQGRAHSQFVVPPTQPGRVPPQRLMPSYAVREVLMRQALLEADCLLTPSLFAKEVYVRHGYPPERIHVLSLSLSSFDRLVRRVRSFGGFPVRFGYLGRVTPLKGAHVLAAAIRDIRPGWGRFTFYGDVQPEDRRYLTALSGDHPDLRFAGRYTHETLARILDEIEVVIFPSVAGETLGFVGVEAQAAGVPVIGSGHAGIAEYVHHGMNGLLFPPGDIVALRSHIASVLETPDLIERFSSRTFRPPPMESHVRDVLRRYAETIAHAGVEVTPA